jgi:hypothetical protein
VFFVPPGDVHYYRGLAFSVLGRKREAVVAFERFVVEHKNQNPARWTKRAEAHLFELVATMEDSTAPARGGRGAYRVVAVATVHAIGGLSAPIIDAAWRARPGLVETCFDDPPPAVRATAGATFRLALDVALDPMGNVKTVKPHGVPSEWKSLGGCLEARVAGGLRTVRGGSGRPTSARIELVLALRP